MNALILAGGLGTRLRKLGVEAGGSGLPFFSM